MGKIKEIEIGFINIFLFYKVEQCRNMVKAYIKNMEYILIIFFKDIISLLSPSPMWQILFTAKSLKQEHMFETFLCFLC